MRYHYEPPKFNLQAVYGETYSCNHPVYSTCTLFKIHDKGLAVIQQRFDTTTKSTFWGEIDDYLRNALYMHPKFREYFEEMSSEPIDGLYPTVPIRKIMWAFKMKPLQKERWETTFDRRVV